MSHVHKAVDFSRQKRIYDGVATVCLLAFILAFVAVGLLTQPSITAETLIIRALGNASLVLLTVILSIGPLARLDQRFLPLLYNRRHLGVLLFLLALAHGAISMFQFHALGVINPLVSVISGNGSYTDLATFPFQALGLLALILFFLLAATSHEFWLAGLSPTAWKSLHLLVYVAYGLVILHVALGPLQVETNPLLVSLLVFSVVWVFGLQLWAAWAPRRRPARPEAGAAEAEDGFVDVGAVADIPEGRAIVVEVGGERVAVFRNQGTVSALSNVCAHQGGPLGEGAILEGCVTCPWHGYQYLPENGQSPPPFDEKVPTYDLRVEAGRVLLRAEPNEPGAHVTPARIESEGEGDAA